MRLIAFVAAFLIAGIYGAGSQTALFSGRALESLPPADFLGNPNTFITAIAVDGVADIAVSSYGTPQASPTSTFQAANVSTAACSGSTGETITTDAPHGFTTGDQLIFDAGSSGGTLPTAQRSTGGALNLTNTQNISAMVVDATTFQMSYSWVFSLYAGTCPSHINLTAAGSGTGLIVANITPRGYKNISPTVTRGGGASPCTGFTVDVTTLPPYNAPPTYLTAANVVTIRNPGTGCTTADVWEIDPSLVGGIGTAGTKINGTVTAVGMSASRTSGYLPAFVQVSVNGLTASGSSASGSPLNCWHDCQINWDFGDTCGPGEQVIDGPSGVAINLNTDQTGGEAMYVYRCNNGGTPFTITATVKGWNGLGYVTQVLTKQFTASTPPAPSNEKWFNPGCWTGSPTTDCASAPGTPGQGGSQSNPYTTADPIAELTAMIGGVSGTGIHAHFAWGSLWQTTNNTQGIIHSLFNMNRVRIDTQQAYNDTTPWNPRGLTIPAAYDAASCFDPANNCPTIERTGGVSGSALMINVGQFASCAEPCKTDWVISNIRFVQGINTNSNNFNGSSDMYFDRISLDRTSQNGGNTGMITASRANRHGIYKTDIRLGSASSAFAATPQPLGGSAQDWHFQVGNRLETYASTTFGGLGGSTHLSYYAANVNNSNLGTSLYGPMRHWLYGYFTGMNNLGFTSLKTRMTSQTVNWLMYTGTIQNIGYSGIHAVPEPNEFPLGLNQNYMFQRVACANLATGGTGSTAFCNTTGISGGQRVTVRDGRAWGPKTTTYMAPDEQRWPLPLYVQPTWHFWRNKIDGQLSPADRGTASFFSNYTKNSAGVNACGVPTPCNAFTSVMELTDNQIRSTAATPALTVADCSGSYAFSLSGSLTARNQYYSPGNGSAAFYDNGSGNGVGAISFTNWKTCIGGGAAETGSTWTTSATVPTGWALSGGGTSDHVTTYSDMGP